MGCASSQAAKIGTEIKSNDLINDTDNKSNDNNNNNNDDTKINNVNVANGKYPPPEAFEVPLDTETDDNNNNTNNNNNNNNSSSIIRKHPPKRLQRLIDPPPSPPSLEDLEEKLANAELRRNQILLQRANTMNPTAVIGAIKPIKQDENETNGVENVTAVATTIAD